MSLHPFSNNHHQIDRTSANFRKYQHSTFTCTNWLQDFWLLVFDRPTLAFRDPIMLKKTATKSRTCMLFTHHVIGTNRSAHPADTVLKTTVESRQVSSG
jgi:hypothetical protein